MLLLELAPKWPGQALIRWWCDRSVGPLNYEMDIGEDGQPGCTVYTPHLRLRPCYSTAEEEIHIKHQI